MKIVYDFRRELQLDILEYFTGERSWFEFYDFLWELPRYGKFNSALAMDDDFAEHLMEQRKEAQAKREEAEENGEIDEQGWHGPTPRSPEGFTPELNALYALDERIQSLARILIMVNSKSKPPDIQKQPRPFTALDMLEFEDERSDMHDLAAKFGLRKPSS